MDMNSDASPGPNPGLFEQGKRLLGRILSPESMKESNPNPEVAPQAPKVIPEASKAVLAPAVPIQSPPEALPILEPHPDRDPCLGPDPLWEGLPFGPDPDWEPGPLAEDTIPSAGPFRIYELLREGILNVGSTLRRVDELMLELPRSYRAGTPPTRLQLLAWYYPKGSPPQALYWVSLVRRQEEPCDTSLQIRALKRPRWWRRLKIKSKKDLRIAIYRNGVASQKETVERYDNLAILLNRAHRALAMGLPPLVRAFERASGGVRMFLDCPELPSEDFIPDLITETQLRLLKCVWRMRWAMEADLTRLYSMGASRKIVLGEKTRPPRQFGRFVWIDLRDNDDFPAFFDGGRPTRHRFSVLPRAQVELMKLLDCRMEIIRIALRRLLTITQDAERDLQKFESEAPTVPGWRNSPSEFPVVREFQSFLPGF